MMQTKKDVELIKAFAERNDELAFAEIVSRYGTMVFRVCFRVLLNRQDAEDASQAVFMTLIKKSGRTDWKDSLACWLFSVARQTALYMARTRANREKRESESSEIIGAEVDSQGAALERELVLKHLVDEVSALSSTQREAIVLRYFQGLSEKDASALTGCSPNTLSRRTFDGVSNLRKRLVRRGCAFGVTALIGVLEAEASAAIPQTLIPSLLTLPKLTAAGATAGTVSVNIISIMEGTMKAMAISKIKTVGLCILIALLIGATAVMAVRETQKRTDLQADDATGFVNSNKKQKNPNLSELSENHKMASMDLAKKNGSRLTKKVKQREISRDFQTEAEKALKDYSHNRSREIQKRLMEILREWMKADFVALKEWALGLRMADRGQVWGLVADTWAYKDPLAAAEWTLELPDGNDRSGVFHSVLSIWAEKDPVAAAEWGRGLPCDSDGPLAEVAKVWAKKDPVAAAQLALEIPEGRYGDWAVSSVAAEWANKDPFAAGEWALGLPEGKVQNWAVGRVVGEWAKKNLGAATKWALGLPVEGARNAAITQVTKVLASKDPLDAAGLVIEIPKGKARNWALAEVAGEWAKKDPVAAAEWALELPDKESRKWTLTLVVKQMARKDPASAAELVSKIPKGEHYTALSFVAFMWIRTDPVAAAKWAVGLPDKESRNRTLNQVAATWAQLDPAAAAKWAVGLPKESRNSALNNAVWYWTEKHPIAAAEWAIGLPEKETRETALSRVAVDWTVIDPECAAEWAIKLPEGNNRDIALNRVISKWGSRNLENCKKWLEESSLSLEIKEKLLKQIKEK